MSKGLDWFRERTGQLMLFKESASEILRARRDESPEGRLKQLHAALRRLNRDDGSFHTEREEPNYLDAARDTARAGDFDAVLYGHTHLPKRISFEEGGRRRWYLNTGTWCDVMQLPAEVGSEFGEARAALGEFTDALVRNEFDRYVRRYLTYAEVVLDGATGRPVEEPGLYSYCGPGRQREAPLTDARA